MFFRLLLVLSVCPAILSGETSAPAELYTLNGRVLYKDLKSFHGAAPVVFLQGAATPYTTRTLADTRGRFSFGKLRPGMYTLVAAFPRAGELRKSVEISRSFADRSGRIAVTMLFDGTASNEATHLVSATDLSVPDSAWRHYEDAQERLGRLELDAAVASLHKAVEIAPQFAAAWNYLGTIAYQSGRLEEAEHLFREALKQNPDAYSPLVNLGGTLLSLGRSKESLPLNQLAVKTRPGDALAHIQLGRNYFSLGHLKEAEQELKAGKALDASHFSLPHLTLIKIYHQRGDCPALVRELEEFLTLHPDSEFAPALRSTLEQDRAVCGNP